MKKRSMLLITGLLLIVMLAGCMDKANDTTGKEVPTNKESQDSTIESDNNSESDEKSDVADINGVMEGNTYKNDYFGIQLTLPDAWSLMNKEDFFDGQIFGATDGYAIDNIMISIEELPTKNYDSKAYLNEVKKQLDYQDQGFTHTVSSIYQRELNGIEYSCFDVVLENETVGTMYQSFYSNVVGDYALGLVFSTNNSANQVIMESFFGEKDIYGTYEGNTYTNEFFNFSLDIPEGWHTLPNEDLSFYSEDGDITLVSASKEEDVDSYPNIQVAMSPLADVTEEEIIDILKESIVASLEEIEYETEFDEGIFTIDGVDFYTLMYSIGDADEVYYQTITFKYNDGYLFALYYSTTESEGVDDLEPFINSIKLK